MGRRILKDDEIIVLNRECNRLLYYDREGIFIKKYVKVFNVRVKFIRILSDVEGRLFVIFSFRDCCDELEEMVEFCIFVYSFDRKF